VEGGVLGVVKGKGEGVVKKDGFVCVCLKVYITCEREGVMN